MPPRNLAKRWRRPLLLARRAVDLTLRLADEAKRLVDEAEWLLSHGRSANETVHCLKRASDRLTQADRRRRTSARYLNHAACVRQGAERVPLFFGQTNGDSIKASALISQISERLEALCAHFLAVTFEIPNRGRMAAEQRRHLPKHPRPSPDVRFDHEQPPPPRSSDHSEGFRRVTRGRAPPRNRTASLHAVLAAAEGPVRLRSLS